MSGGFKDREKSFENKWAHDEELRFKVTARRNKLLGLWAAGEMGLSGDAAAAYAKEIVVADMAETGDEDVIRKILADFSAKGVTRSDHLVRTKLEELLAVAGEQLMSEKK